MTAASAVLYTDLDHTLHRSDAYRTKHGIIPGSPDTPFFEFANVLEQLLAPFKEVVIVLSTSWVQELGFEETRSRFPTASLRARIVDSTYHPGDELAPVWGYITRGAQVLRHVRHHRLTRWLAVDDDRQGFDGYESHLIHCQRSVGLGDKDVQELFARRLELMFGTPDSLSSDVSPKPECPR
ncbi:hypothetical protein A6V36_30440 [Paraburkholderia ginsengiterrae]|uniref:Uncharacterized protein n=1 Tax=Paraburkholderia ginsengiterrae TaxID=1462993 RepID=A0A1A9N4L5_9BURK|nr:hypothetical protein A6V37_32180 [Paraburkholderia ginsengiterrae]OAJ58619.1 hypothetical protein A6V36_30440 [Paraburkholderia ginsengiterrae]